MLDRAEMLIPPLPWDKPRENPNTGPTVVLLHGLWRGWHAMEPLARSLHRRGFATLNVPYPSTRLPVEVLARRVAEVLRPHAERGPLHFVTHSLGGIVLRAMLANAPAWQTGRVVMLAPPNQGSEIVDWAAGKPIIPLLLGPAGRELGTGGHPATLPGMPEEVETAVIMGRRSTLPLFRKLLDGENDGIVSAQRGQVAGMNHFAVVNADHTFIQMHPEVVRLVGGFLGGDGWETRDA